MKLNPTPPVNPPLGALHYEIGDHVVAFYPDDPFTREASAKALRERVQAVAPDGVSEAHAAEAAGCLRMREAFAPGTLLFAPDVDPDSIGSLKGAELWEAAEACRADLYSMSTARLGIDRRRFAMLHSYSAFGWTQDEGNGAIEAAKQLASLKSSADGKTTPAPSGGE